MTIRRPREYRLGAKIAATATDDQVLAILLMATHPQTVRELSAHVAVLSGRQCVCHLPRSEQPWTCGPHADSTANYEHADGMAPFYWSRGSNNRSTATASLPRLEAKGLAERAGTNGRMILWRATSKAHNLRNALDASLGEFEETE